MLQRSYFHSWAAGEKLGRYARTPAAEPLSHTGTRGTRQHARMHTYARGTHKSTELKLSSNS